MGGAWAAECGVLRGTGDDLIKIGISDRLFDRMYRLRRAYGPVRLLGFEPGSYELETKRKHQFAAVRTRGPHLEMVPPEG